jgi:hypothetical protein
MQQTELNTFIIIVLRSINHLSAVQEINRLPQAVKYRSSCSRFLKALFLGIKDLNYEEVLLFLLSYIIIISSHSGSDHPGRVFQ